MEPQQTPPPSSAAAAAAALKPHLSRRISPSFRLTSPSLDTLRLRRVFDLFDGNGDGEITTDEIHAALDRLGLGADPSELEGLVAAHIRPGRSGLGFDEFQGLHRAVGDAMFGEADEVVGAEEEEMAEAFKVFDEDGDGLISARELQAVLGKLGLEEGKSMEKVEKMICFVDSNRDGSVDFTEFKRMMEGITVRSS